MVSSHPRTATNRYSLALLALKRFVKRLTKGTLQQVGVGLAALLTVLKLGTPTSALPAPAASPHPLQSISTRELILQASMTHHHLTRARLTVPTTVKRPMVSRNKGK